MKHLIALAVAGGFALAGRAQQEVVVIADTAGPGNKNQQKVITLRLKGDQADEKKYVIEIDGDKIKVNGKDVADLKDIEVNIGKSRAFGRNNITINGQPLSRIGELRSTSPGMSWHNGDMSPLESIAMNSNSAFLGIGMEKTDDGVKVTDITEKSGAEKAGLKEGDVIVKIDGKDVKTEMDITKTVGSHKPGDEIDVIYKRGGKENKVKATLGKREGIARAWGFSGDGDSPEGWNEKVITVPGQHFDFKLASPPGDFKFFHNEEGGDFPAMVNVMRGPRLGVSVKETEVSKGLEVTDVDENSAAAKAGLKKGDIITEVGGKNVNTVDEIRKAVSENKDKAFNVKYSRDGKAASVEIKFPKKLKQTDL